MAPNMPWANLAIRNVGQDLLQISRGIDTNAGKLSLHNLDTETVLQGPELLKLFRQFEGGRQEGSKADKEITSIDIESYMLVAEKLPAAEGLILKVMPTVPEIG
jgi:hypothetical protein